MAFDGLMLAAVTDEVAAALTGARVNKVYQPGDWDIVLHLWGHGANYKLLISAHPQHARLHLTTVSFENPPTPPAFCMLLRKHLEGARCLGLEQPGWERLCRLRFSATDELGVPTERVLIAETMGKFSNVVLLDGDGRILDALRRSGGAASARLIWPGRPYVPPPAQGKADPLDTALAAKLAATLATATPHDTVAAVVQRTVAGFSPDSAREAAYRAGFAVAAPVSALPAAALDKLATAVANLAEAARRDAAPVCVTVAPNRTAFAPFPLTHLATADTRTFASPSQLLDYVYGERVAAERVALHRAAIMRQLRELIARHRRKLAHQEEAVREAGAAETWRLYGELLTSQLHAVPAGADSVSLPNWYDADAATVTIALDPRLSPAANAQAYFKRFRKAQATAAAAGRQASQTRDELAYLEQVEAMVEQAQTVADLDEIAGELMAEGYVRGRRRGGSEFGDRPRRSRTGRPVEKRDGHGRPTPPLRFRSSDGLDILVGKNNRQNDWLTGRRAAAGDIWLHAKDVPGSHVILVLPPGVSEPPPASLREAAALAAHYSKARQAARVQVDYTERRHVHKPRGAKPGMVIYEHHRTLAVAPDGELADKLTVQAGGN